MSRRLTDHTLRWMPRRLARDCALLTTPAFLRLWAIGGCVNTMRFFELLAAALFTLDVTGSGLAVAVVSAARTMPMLLFGAFSGVVTESVSRKHVLQIGQLLTCVSAIIIAALAVLGVVRPWHLAVSSFVSGMVWSTEMATRRRMVGESVDGHLVSRALALDTMSNSGARLVGPIAAGMIYQHFGIAGSYAVSAGVYALAAWITRGVRYHQQSRQIRGQPGAARPCRGRRVRPRPHHHRRRAGRHHRDEPAGVSVFRAGRADRPPGVRGIADIGRHARRIRGVRRFSGRPVADQRRTATVRADADGRRLADVRCRACS